jgi:hypothetical protein
MRQLWKKAAALGFLLFLGLWIAGTTAGLAPPSLRQAPAAAPPAAVVWSQSISDSTARRQLANNMRQLGLARAPLPVVLEQVDVEQARVHEKSARIATSAVSFEADEAEVRAAIEEQRALVINETSGGREPERRLTLEIGVHPDKYDALVDRLGRIGRLESVSVQQQDRTNEFRQLYARRQSLKKQLESVRKLLARDHPTIDDSLKVEQKIHDLERELRSVSVQLGDLVGKESFYHVYLTLVEHLPGAGPGRASFLVRRTARAFLWATAWWCVAAVVLGASGGAYVSARTLLRAGESTPSR